jgi:hypothetical protein
MVRPRPDAEQNLRLGRIKYKNPPITRLELTQALLDGVGRRLPALADLHLGEDKDGDPTIEARVLHPSGPDGWTNVTMMGDSHWKNYLAGDPLSEILDRVVTAIEDMLRPVPDWAEARRLLRVQLVDRAHVEREEAEYAGTGGHYCARPWAFDAWVRVCLDLPRSLASIGSAQLRRWGQPEAAVWRLALEQTRRMLFGATGTRTRHPNGAVYRVYERPSGYVATRVLWPDLFGPLPPTRARLVIAPNRDLCVAVDVSMRGDRARMERVLQPAIEDLRTYHEEAAEYAYRGLPLGTVLYASASYPHFKQTYPLDEFFDTVAPAAETLIPED